MKKFLKFLGIGVFILIAAGIILGNIARVVVGHKSNSSNLTLEEMIVKMNNALPQKASNISFLTMNQVSLENNSIVWDATLYTTFFYPAKGSTLPESINGGILIEGSRDDIIDIDTLLSSSFVKEDHQLDMLFYFLFVRKDKPNPFYEELIRRNISQTWRIHSPFSDRQVEFAMTSDDQKRSEEFCREEPVKAYQEFLFRYLIRQNRLLRFASNNSDISMKMSDEGSSLMFYYTFDKSYSNNGNKPISNIKENGMESYLGIKEDLKVLPMFYGLEEICKGTGKKLVFRITDWNKTDSVEYSFFE